MASLATLPLELKSKISSYLRKSELAKLARVSSEWKDITEPSIYRTLNLRDMTWEEVHDLSVSSKKSSGGGKCAMVNEVYVSAGYQEVFERGLTWVFPNVLKVQIDGGTDANHLEVSGWRGMPNTITYMTLLGVSVDDGSIPSMPNLETLRCYSVDFDHDRPKAYHLLPSFPKLKTFHMVGCYTKEPYIFSKIPSSLIHLECDLIDMNDELHSLISLNKSRMNKLYSQLQAAQINFHGVLTANESWNDEEQLSEFEAIQPLADYLSKSNVLLKYQGDPGRQILLDPLFAPLKNLWLPTSSWCSSEQYLESQVGSWNVLLNLKNLQKVFISTQMVDYQRGLLDQWKKAGVEIFAVEADNGGQGILPKFLEVCSKRSE